MFKSKEEWRNVNFDVKNKQVCSRTTGKSCSFEEWLNYGKEKNWCSSKKVEAPTFKIENGKVIETVENCEILSIREGEGDG